MSGAVPVHVMPKPGVMDPVALSALEALRDMKINLDAVRTFRKFWIQGADQHDLNRLCQKVLSNDSIEQVHIGPLALTQLAIGSTYQLQVRTVSLTKLSDEQLLRLSKEGQLYLSLAEMQTIQKHYESIGREPTDIELETIAQTWSEHCSHKTWQGVLPTAMKMVNGISITC